MYDESRQAEFSKSLKHESVINSDLDPRFEDLGLRILIDGEHSGEIFYSQENSVFFDVVFC